MFYRYLSIRRAGIILLTVMLVFLPGWDGKIPSQPGESEAYFKFDIPPNTETFIIQLTDPLLIAEARAILSGQAPSRQIMGQVIKEQAAYNAPWNYHLDPDTIQFFRSATEVCDASIIEVEENLAEVCGAFLPGCTWCPWGSRLIEEVQVEQMEWLLYLPMILR